MRRLLAGVSAFGIAVSIVAYLESLSGATIDDMPHLMTVVVFGAIAIQIPMFVIERSSVKSRAFFWKGFARATSRWAVFFVGLFWLIAVAHFIWFFIRGHHAVPVIKDGQFILSSRGRIVKALTHAEYLTLRADELRTLAALMVACYLAPLMYWLFPRRSQRPSESD